jgi:signal transduction histidine kinase
MYPTLLDQWLFFIYFIYGLAFFGMGLAMALESGRSPGLAEARVLRPLAAFGLIHGAHEWFESYLLQASSIPSPLPAWIPWLRIATLTLSFPCLFLFAYNFMGLGSLQTIQGWIKKYNLLGLYWLALTVSALIAYRDHPLPGLVFWDTMARYWLAVPASLLAALALSARSRQARVDSRPQLARYFLYAAVGFAIYMLSQFIVHPMNMFPANVINQAMFTHYTGIPIQLVRSIVAVLITHSLIRATQVVEEERHAQLDKVQQGRLEALQQRDDLRRKLLQHTVQAQEDERSRIARELHDETAQALSAFSLELAALDAGLKPQSQAHARVETLKDLSRQVSQGVYRLVGDLRPAHLDDLGLVPAINYLLADARASHDINFNLQVEGTMRRLDLAVETVLFRVAQEAITNIVRHSEAKRARIELCFNEVQVQLTISDEGRGFDTSGPFRAPHGWGLEGMRERVEAAGGSLSLASSPGRGTLIAAVIPVGNADGVLPLPAGSQKSE